MLIIFLMPLHQQRRWLFRTRWTLWPVEKFEGMIKWNYYSVGS
jgi:hypothetical protein